MNIGQIRYFVSVFEAKSFSAASKRLSVTVQAVSKAISDLEREIDAPLFVRKSRGVEPTLLAEGLYERAVDVLRSYEDLDAFAHASDKECAVPPCSVELALCSPAFQGFERALSNIAAYLKDKLRFPAQLRLAGMAEGLELLRSAQVDALVTIGVYSSPDTDCVHVFDAPTGVLLSDRHPLAKQRCVSLAQLEPYTAVFSPKFDMHNESIYQLYQRAGFQGRTEVVETTEHYIDLIQERNGFAFLVGLPALGDTQRGTVVVPICEKDAVPVPICFVTDRQRKSPAYIVLERLFVKSDALNRGPR